MELRTIARRALAASILAALLAPRAALAADPPGQVIELDEPKPATPAPAPPPPATPPPDATAPAQPTDTTAPAAPKGTLRFVIRGSASEQIRVTVDGFVLTGAALRTLPLEVRPGHEVVVATLGNVERRQDVDVAVGKEQTVVLDFTGVPEPAIAPVAARPAPVDTTPAKHVNYTIPLVGAGVAVVGLAIGIGETLVALSHKSTLEASCASDGRCGPAQHDDVDAAKSAANVATVGYVVAGVGVGVAVVGYVLARKRADAEAATAPKPEVSRAPKVEPWIGLGSAGLRGAF